MSARFVLLILAVTDLARAVRFYRDAFGWTQTVDVPVYVEFALPDGMRFGLYERNAFAANTGERPHAIPREALSPTEVYLYVDDLDEAIARLDAGGARWLSARAPRPWGDEAAYCADPDGNVVVVARPIAAA